ncbi:hypothetical protein QMZ93_07635 [Pantoea stewartii subsp. indologenes]|uniref:hypothetical protein n=1 Tax=Pantoea stewartii TaxID=66269 RepID=UPI00197EE974|nr:hypothetical protein [Pantoea stewartii]MDK2633214.1 hypothetical protein [Pantoea stewartii subsp. indologenes]
MTVFIALHEEGNERHRARRLHISSGKGRAKTVKILCLFTLLRLADWPGRRCIPALATHVARAGDEVSFCNKFHAIYRLCPEGFCRKHHGPYKILTGVKNESIDAIICWICFFNVVFRH